MTRVALLIRGQFRLSDRRHDELLDETLRCLSHVGWNVDLHVATYTDSVISRLYEKNLCSITRYQSPSDEYIRSTIETVAPGASRNRWEYGSPLNTFRQYRTASIGIAAVRAYDSYDLVVNTRPDCVIDIAPESAQACLDGLSYNAPHISSETQFTNDQIGIARPSIMEKAWNPLSIPNLAQLVAKSLRGEDPLDMMIYKNELHCKRLPIRNWGQHLQRE